MAGQKPVGAGTLMVYFIRRQSFLAPSFNSLLSLFFLSFQSRSQSHPPRILWYNMMDQKLVAECTGKGDASPLGYAGTLRQSVLDRQVRGGGCFGGQGAGG